MAACALLGSACVADTDPRDELLDLQAVEREAHLSYDADLLARHLADSMVTVTDGDVRRRSRAEMRRRLADYFDAVTFLGWSDIEAPVVRVAASGELATVRVRRRVRLATVDSAGRTDLDHRVFAWWESWRKEGGRWRLAGMASTDRPGEADVAGTERRAALESPDRSPGEILARGRAAAAEDTGRGADSVRSLSFRARGHGPGGAFRTSVRSDRTGAIELRQTTVRGRRVHSSVGPLAGPRSDSSAADRAFLQGHALLHLAVDPVAVLGPPLRSGRLTFAGVSAEAVVFRDAAGRPLDLVYGRASGELIGARIRDPRDPGEVVLLYLSGRRNTGGLRIPRRAVFLDGDEAYLYRIEDVRVVSG